MGIPNLPMYISLAFVITTFLTFLLFWKSANYNKNVLWIGILWLVLHGILALTGFYLNNSMPPRILLTFFPTFMVMLVLFLNKNGTQWMATLDMKALTLLHLVRIPVELILYGLFIYGAIPELMTFEGRNFDILAGITAPFIYYFGFIKKSLERKFILLWNVVCLGLLLNIVVNALLSAPLPFQQFAFDQPNIAVLYFPLIWLPAFVVPVVFFSHLVVISRILKTAP